MLNIITDPFPTLSSQRLVLRALRDEDAAPMFEMRSDPVVMRYLDRPMAHSINDALSLMDRMNTSQEKGEGITWILCTHESTEMMGYIGFWRMEKENFRTEVGYMMRKQFEGQGWMSEALQLLVTHAFESMGFHSICADVNPMNARSIRLLERNGFVREALFRENYYFEGKFLDTAIYSRIKDR